MKNSRHRKGSRERSISRADTFYSALEQYLKRFTPSVFIPKIAATLLDNLGNFDRIRYFPPHVLFTLLDTCCAYHRPNYPQILIDEKWLKKLCNHFNDYKDPYIDYLLKEKRDLFLFLQTFVLKQFDYQRKPNENQFVRAISLISNQESLKKTKSEVIKHYGFSLDDWVFLCFCLILLTNKFPNLICSLKYFDSSEIVNFPKQSVYPFLKEIGITQEEVKEIFFEMRKDLPSFLHMYLPSVFISKPVFISSKDIFSPLHPYLIMKKCYEGIFDLTIKLGNPDLMLELGRAFEDYVEKIINILEIKTFIKQKEIEKIVSGKSSDFIIDVGNSYIIIECKAARLSSYLTTENALANDNITNKLADAFIQIVSTASEIRKGSFHELDPNKNLLGFCVIFGDMEFVNNHDYIENYVLKKLNKDDLEIFNKSKLDCLPQIFTIENLENLILISINYGYSIDDLVYKKLEIPYNISGDWGPYLDRLNTEKKFLELPFREDVFDKYYDGFFNQIGFKKNTL